jgi:hypothetical protein
MREPYILFFLGSPGNQLAQTLAEFFNPKERAPPNRKKDFHSSCPPKNEGIRGIFVKSSKEL